MNKKDIIHSRPENPSLQAWDELRPLSINRDRLRSLGRSNRRLIGRVFSVYFFVFTLFFFPKGIYAFEEIITVPAESPQGVTVDLAKGSYLVKIEGGAIALFYPINPNYRWLIAMAVATNASGGQDEPDIGTLYFEPRPLVYTQAAAEQEALKATQQGLEGTRLQFTLLEAKKVRFWVSDFDYSDNSGMVKLKIKKIN